MPERDLNRLPTSVVPSHYDLELAPDLDAATFTGTEAVTLVVTEPTDELVLHALDLELTEVWLEHEGRRVEVTPTFDRPSETVTLALAETVEPGPWLLRASFTGELNDKLVGFYRSTFTDDSGATRTIACTQFESTHARRAFPCWDEPAFKATFAIRLVVPDDLFAVSNSLETAVDELPDGRRRVHFAPTMHMSTYLVAFVVGPLEVGAATDVDGVPLRVIGPPGTADLTAFALDIGAFSLRFLADWYGIAYPGDKLDLIAIPDFAFGAMENLGCVTFRETALLLDEARSTQAEQQRVADVVAHEIAHMWFGDLVTMGWWNGIWLNEAFATFMEMLTTDAYRPEWKRWVDFGTARSAAYDTDSLCRTRAIEYEVVTAADAEGMFDVLTYEKGASVVRMLQQFLGEDRFQAGIRHYLDTHQYGNTETTDLWDAIEEATGEPVRQMMDSWIYRPGHPVVRLERAEGATLAVSQDRFTFASDPASGVEIPEPEVRTVPVVLRAGAEDGSTTIHRVLLDAAATTVELGAAPAWVVGNHEGNGFYRVELADADLAAVAAAAPVHLSPLERYGLVEDEWALLLAGRGSVPRLLGLLRHLAADDDLNVWQRTVGALAGLHRAASPGDRPALEAYVRALAGPALQRLGDAAVAGEGERTTALRAALFDGLARVGADEARRAQARAHFAAMATDPAALDADLADAVVRVVAASADQATWDELRRRAGTARTAQDRLRHQGALADAPEPALVVAFAELCLTDEVRTQDALFLLRRALANRHAASEVWQFATDRWDDITTRFPSSTVPRFLEGIRTISDPALAADVAAFVAAHPPAAGTTVVRQHLERMWVSVALGRRVQAELGAALSVIIHRRGPALQVFAVDDTDAQLTWRGLPPGPLDVHVVEPGVGAALQAEVDPGGAGAALITGLPAGRLLTFEIRVADGRLRRRSARTLRTLPGEERCRIATISDLHLGTTTFGQRGTILEPEAHPDPHPRRCAQSAVDDALAWGAQRFVAKGDLTHLGRPDEWRQYADLVARCGVPVDAVPGNHDRGFPKRPGALTPEAAADAFGFSLARPVLVRDLPGARLVLGDTTVPGRNSGSLDRVAEPVLDAVAEAPRDGGVLVVLHHQIHPPGPPEHLPRGIRHDVGAAFLDRLGAAHPHVLVTSGHTHRHRRWGRAGVTVTQVGSTKDYPGVWAGYVVHEGGIRQIVRRVSAPDCLRWTDHTRTAAYGFWEHASPGRLDARCFDLTWTRHH